MTILLRGKDAETLEDVILDQIEEIRDLGPKTGQIRIPSEH